MRSGFVVLSLLTCLIGSSAPVAAQEDGPATGWFVQARMPVTTLSSLVSSTLGSPQFLVGVRRERSGFGLGVGVNRFSFTSENSGPGFSREDKTTATLFQIAPAAWFDFFTSPDGATVGNVLMSVGYGRLSTKQESKFSSPSGPGSSESKSSGSLVDLSVGLGGDHFLGPHFSLGVETGIHGAFAFDIKSDLGGGDKVGFSAALFYSGVRSTIVF